MGKRIRVTVYRTKEDYGYGANVYISCKLSPHILWLTTTLRNNKKDIKYIFIRTLERDPAIQILTKTKYPKDRLEKQFHFYINIPE